jgi:hypothetical protein
MNKSQQRPRGEHGHFLPKKDIQKKDVDNAIRMITEEQVEIAMRIKKPVKVEMDLTDVHIYHHTENDEFLFKYSMAVLALVTSIFLLWWMVIR